MDKVKFDFNNAIIESVDIGNGIVVQKSISSKDKQEIALRRALFSIIDDQKNEITYLSYKDYLVQMYLIVKYYTNILEPQFSDSQAFYMFADYIISTGVYKSIMQVIHDDYEYTERIFNDVKQSMMCQIKNKYDVLSALKKSFGFLFTGQDITQTLAKTSELNNQMVNIMSEYMKHNRVDD